MFVHMRECSEWYSGQRRNRLLLRFGFRPNKPTCIYFAKTGTCKWGAQCKFDHPRDARDDEDDYEVLMERYRAKEKAEAEEARIDAAWTQVGDSKTGIYFWNSITNATSWEKPDLSALNRT